MSDPSGPDPSPPPHAPAPDAPPPAPEPRGPTRRRVLRIAVITAAAAATGVAAPFILNRVVSTTQPPTTWRFLTDAEATLLGAVCEQIIPTDQDPGARDAGCVVFIDRQLVGPHERYAERYRKGLAALQATAKALHLKPFEQLAWDVQTRLLEQVESNKAPKEHWAGIDQGDFFRAVRDHTMQGFYGSPRHGGNKDYVSYRMIGIEAPRVVGRNTQA